MFRMFLKILFGVIIVIDCRIFGYFWIFVIFVIVVVFVIILEIEINVWYWFDFIVKECLRVVL